MVGYGNASMIEKEVKDELLLRCEWMLSSSLKTKENVRVSDTAGDDGHHANSMTE
jgi:hypothetical protein